MLELYVLASGSSGNAAVIRNEAIRQSVLVDCGICKRDFFNRCDQLELDPFEIEAVLVTHGHTDHTSGLGVVLRGLAKQGCRPALYTHELVRKASKQVQETANIVEQQVLTYNETVELAGISVLPFHTMHDVFASVGFRFETPKDALGYITDSGCITPEAHAALSNVRILAIESNHDVVMLREGPYPEFLQERILSNAGHLSNNQCCAEVEQLLHPGLEQIVAMHISEHNNTFGLPVRELQKVLDSHGHPAHVQAGLPRTPIKVV